MVPGTFHFPNEPSDARLAELGISPEVLLFANSRLFVLTVRLLDRWQDEHLAFVGLDRPTLVYKVDEYTGRSVQKRTVIKVLYSCT
ncbi:hypothetical protein GCM10009650_13060 [Nesterenkonia jeotgali]